MRRPNSRPSSKPSTSSSEDSSSAIRSRSSNRSDRNQPQWLIPAYPARTRSTGAPNTRHTRAISPIGESQMPITRSPSTGRSASVIMPAGLVKLTNQALGATSATTRAISSATGSVRRPYDRPARPTVSWPSTPASSARRSSRALAAAPPTRIAEKTTSAPRSARGRSVSARIAGPPPRAASTAAITASRLGSASCSTSSWTCRLGRATSAACTSGTRKPPPPSTTSRIDRP